MRKKETKELSEHLQSMDDEVLMFVALSTLLEQPFPDATNDYIEVMFKNKELLQNIAQQSRHLCLAKYQAGTGTFGFSPSLPLPSCN